MSKEQLKSFGLVSMFGLCVLLVSQIWSDISLDIFSYSKPGNSVEFEKVQISQVISPQGYIFNFGGNSHTVNFSDKYQVWQQAKPTLIEFFKNENEIVEIDKSDWEELNTYPSIQFEFPYQITSDLFVNLVEESIIKAALLEPFDKLLISLNDKETVYLGNSETNQYYSIKGSAFTDDLGALFSYVENSESTIYHTVEDHYGLKNILGVESTIFEENRNLMPRYQITDIPVVKVKKEIDIADDSEENIALIQEYANRAFDGRFDFVNRLQDADGSVVFLYGYGERALKIGSNGELEYKEKLDENEAGPTLNVKDSLKVAVDFINNFGGVPQGLYLTSLEETKSASNRGYKFTFSYRVQGLPVVNSRLVSGSAIEVEVYGTQVLSFKRLIRKYTKLADIPDEMVQQFTIDDVFSMNFNQIHDDYQKTENEPFDKNKIYQILQRIDDIEIVYFADVTRNSERLIPAWHIEIGSNEYYFNMHSGNILR